MGGAGARASVVVVSPASAARGSRDSCVRKDVMRLDTVAIVPAGGAARRLGPIAAGGKAAVDCGGRTLLDRVCTALASEVSRVIVVAAPHTRLPPVAIAVEVIHDSVAGAGPLAAVRDGLVHACAAAPRPRLAVLCACDLPLLNAGVVARLIDVAAAPGVRWVLPVVDGHPQPLLSVIAVDLLPEIKVSCAAGGRSLRDLAASIARAAPGAVLTVGADELRGADPALDSFRDVDTPEDRAAVERLGEPRPRAG